MTNPHCNHDLAASPCHENCDETIIEHDHPHHVWHWDVRLFNFCPKCGVPVHDMAAARMREAMKANDAAKTDFDRWLPEWFDETRQMLTERWSKRKIPPT